VTKNYAGGKLVRNRKAVVVHIGIAFDLAKAQGLKPNRVVAAKFGCMRLWGIATRISQTS